MTPAPPPPELTPEDLAVLREMFGMDETKPRRMWGRWNYYNADGRHPKFQNLERLRKAGMVLRSSIDLWRGLVPGAEAAGFTPQEIHRMKRERVVDWGRPRI